MELNLDDFQYQLPEERIAKYPLPNRSDSKLLVCDNGKIEHRKFKDVPGIIDHNSLLVFNNTKVIPARIILHKETGARIEIFLLKPLDPATNEEMMSSTTSCKWECMIGNAKKWTVGTQLAHPVLSFRATRIASGEVAFEWEGEDTFSEMLLKTGKIPLPPYLNRDTEASDVERYQTVYSKFEGAVAAPTAGLHFTESLLNEMDQKGISRTELTLHVSAGTFQPIKTNDVTDHKMHNERIGIKKETVEMLLNKSDIIPIGTTSMRTLESLYWFGVKLRSGNPEFLIGQREPSSLPQHVDRNQALAEILAYMEQHQYKEIWGSTEIFIYPGYKFRLCNALFTNFHQPGSTLILLIAAFIGEDWKNIYESALNNDYRFLSYGDSSLLRLKE